MKLVHKNTFSERLISVLISPYFLALPVTVLIVLLLPEINKYKVERVKTGLANKIGGYDTYCDLDNDGYSEKVILFNSQKGEAALKFLNASDVQVQWLDYHGTIFPKQAIHADVDHDGRGEVFFISVSHDSLYLNMALTGKDGTYFAKHRFITLMNLRGKPDDYRVNYVPSCDLDLDGTDEMIFQIFAGYSLQPRRLYAYDLKGDTVYRGPLMGCQVIFVPTQLDDDPYPEFLGQSSSTDNIPSGSAIPYTDSSSWLMAIDHKLEFLFPPVEFMGHKSFIQSQKILIDNQPAILCLFELSNPVQQKRTLMTYRTDGVLLNNKELPVTGSPEYFNLIWAHDPFNEVSHISNRDGEIFQVNPDLALSRIKSINAQLSSHKLLQIDDDGQAEILFLCSDLERFCILRSDLSHPVFIPIQLDMKRSIHFCLQHQGKQDPLIFMQQGDREVWFSYGINYLWYARFPLWAGIYLLILGFIHVIRRFQLIQQKKLKSYENELAQLQLGAVGTYLDPHFTFNTLNTITGLIYKEDKNKAHEIMTRFTSLIRAALMQSGEVTRTLGDELEFVRNFLDIQAFRFGHIFSWKIHYDENVDLTQIVPKMLVQLYAENAIKHGLKNKGEGGRLEINLSQARETTIIIRDNGVGREKARMNAEPGTGKGLYTMQQIFDLFEKTNKIRITQTISDLTDDSGLPTGTEVVITIRRT